MGDDHRAAIALFIEVNPTDSAIKSSSNQLIKLIQIKTDAEYGERSMTKKDADSAKLAMERFLKFISADTIGFQPIGRRIIWMVSVM